MKVAIAGAGAVGCHYGSLMQQAGIEVVFLARGEHLRAMRREGLVHITPRGEVRLKVQASDDPSCLEAADVVFLTCKTTGLQALCEQMRGHLKPGAILVTLQNGIEAPALVAGLFPGHPVIAGSAFIGARIERPGCVVHSAAGLIRIAPWAHADEEHMAAVLDLLDQAGVPVERCEDARTMLWHKMLWNCGFNAITALTRRHARDIACFDETARIAREAMLETLRAAVADGARLDEEEVDRQMRITRELGPVKTSMWQDIEQGRKTEIEAMNGQVVVVSREHGLDAPVNAMLTALIHALEAREH